MQRPATGVIISRDYTPLGVHVAPDGGTTLDLDFVLHGDEGPASAWAARADVGIPTRHRRATRLAPGAHRSRPPAGHRRRDGAARDAALARTGAGVDPGHRAVRCRRRQRDRLLRGRRSRVDAEWLFARGRSGPARRGAAIARSDRRRHLRIHGRRGDRRSFRCAATCGTNSGCRPSRSRPAATGSAASSTSTTTRRSTPATPTEHRVAPSPGTRCVSARG